MCSSRLTCVETPTYSEESRDLRVSVVMEQNLLHHYCQVSRQLAYKP